MTRSEIIKIKKDNTRLYPIYRSISYDLIFYYTIILIFLTEARGLSTSDVIMGNAFYGLFNVIFQIPLLVLTDKLGKRKSMILGNIFNCISVMLILVCNNLVDLIIAQLFSSLAFSMKNISESSILNDSIPSSKKKGKLVAKVDGAGTANYYYLNAASSVLAGYLFNINSYIPIALSLVITVITVILSLRFKEIKPSKNVNEKEVDEENVTEKVNRKYFRELKQAFEFIFKSKRLKGLIMFSAVFYAVYNLMSSYEISLLSELQISTRDIGVAFAVFGVISGLASKKQNIFHDKFKNKTLTFIGVSFMLMCVISGLIARTNVSLFILGAILITYAIRYADNGLFVVSIKRYLGNFTNARISSKIYSVNFLVQSFARAIVGFLGSMLLEFTVTSNTAILIVGCIGTLAMFAITGYMKSRVGLKPNEYKKEDIEFHYEDENEEDDDEKDKKAKKKIPLRFRFKRRVENVHEKRKNI